ncbi:MAG: hypothetical protein AAF633_11805, partial [Chloroflexota bacterium]
MSAVVSGHRSQLKAISQAWLSDGATSFSIWADGEPLIGWPKGADFSTPAMKAAVRLNGVDIGNICISGLGTPTAEE